jgi:homoserine O-succinyltransferase
MPVFVDSNRTANHRARGGQKPHRKATLQFPDRASRVVTIGLVNNMPDAAFRATERQFISLLDQASDEIPVKLLLYSLPGVPRTGASLHHAESHYSCTETLRETSLDGLIVTGREPTTLDLKHEPYWESFTRLLEWARLNTHSTVWSCLAAHAAILHMDGINRSKSCNKHFGALQCTRVAAHAMTAGAPATFCVPHSRWNGVAEDALNACGYTVLSRTNDAGVDSFVKEQDSLFVFFQGHPEYEADTLLREYRRDAARYLKGESDSYPLLPSGYFDEPTAGALSALREEAIACRSKQLLTRVAAVLEKPEIENTWRLTASKIYRNWLEYIRARKSATQMDDGNRLARAASL